jgi:hypothetical protein
MLTSAEVGDTEAVRVTGPLKPLVGDAATVYPILFPAVIIAEAGVAAIVKSPAAKTGVLTTRIAASVPTRIDILRKASGLF